MLHIILIILSKDIQIPALSSNGEVGESIKGILLT